MMNLKPTANKYQQIYFIEHLSARGGMLQAILTFFTKLENLMNTALKTRQMKKPVRQLIYIR
ncbi:MAG: hypothetical protein K8H86_02360 [Ignavibacteriaceae bacterium]|nr:hypothetical protein [Ignavibacteriaceae bacterium]